jgi:hypothetical protein
MTKVTQIQKIVEFCKAHTWITQRDAYKLGIYRLASRIYDMVQMGFAIIDEYIKVENADGSSSYVKRYSIVKYPEKEVYNVG